MATPPLSAGPSTTGKSAPPHRLSSRSLHRQPIPARDAGERATSWLAADLVIEQRGRLLRCMGPLVALSWLNLPCGSKAAFGYGERTLGNPRQSAAPQGPRQGPAASAFL